MRIKLINKCAEIKIRAERRTGEILKDLQVLVEQWRKHYDEARPHSSLGYRPSAPQVIVSDKKTKELNDGFFSTH